MYKRGCRELYINASPVPDMTPGTMYRVSRDRTHARPVHVTFRIDDTDSAGNVSVTCVRCTSESEPTPPEAETLLQPRSQKKLHLVWRGISQENDESFDSDPTETDSAETDSESGCHGKWAYDNLQPLDSTLHCHTDRILPIPDTLLLQHLDNIHDVGELQDYASAPEAVVAGAARLLDLETHGSRSTFLEQLLLHRITLQHAVLCDKTPRESTGREVPDTLCFGAMDLGVGVEDEQVRKRARHSSDKQTTALKECLIENLGRNDSYAPQVTVSTLLARAREQYDAHCSQWLLLQGLLLYLVHELATRVNRGRLTSCSFDEMRAVCRKICPDAPFRMVALACISVLAARVEQPESTPSIVELFCTAISGSCLCLSQVSLVCVRICEIDEAGVQRLFDAELTRSAFQCEWNLRLVIPNSTRAEEDDDGDEEDGADADGIAPGPDIWRRLSYAAIEGLTALQRSNSATITVACVQGQQEENIRHVEREFPSVTTDMCRLPATWKFTVLSGADARTRWLALATRGGFNLVGVEKDHSSVLSIEDTVFGDFPPVLSLGQFVSEDVPYPILRAVCGTQDSLLQYIDSYPQAPYDWALVVLSLVDFRMVPFQRLHGSSRILPRLHPVSSKDHVSFNKTAETLHTLTMDAARVHRDVLVKTRELNEQVHAPANLDGLENSQYCPGGCGHIIPATKQFCYVTGCPVDDDVTVMFDERSIPYCGRERLTVDAANALIAGHLQLSRGTFGKSNDAVSAVCSDDGAIAPIRHVELSHNLLTNFIP